MRKNKQALAFGVLSGLLFGCGGAPDVQIALVNATDGTPIPSMECEWFEGASRFSHNSGHLKATLRSDTNGIIELFGLRSSRENTLMLSHPGFPEVIASLSADRLKLFRPPTGADPTWMESAMPKSNGVFWVAIPPLD